MHLEIDCCELLNLRRFDLMFEFEVIPEHSLRNESIEFIIGMPLVQAINSLQRLAGIVKGIELLYSHENCLGHAIAIVLSHDGIKLIFDPVSQRLKVIEIYDLSKVALKYSNCIFSSPSEKATVETIDHAFGATHPGVYDSTLQMYILTYRGLSFLFPVESNLQPTYAHGLGSLQLNSSSSSVSKLCIYYGTSLSDAQVPELPLQCYLGNCYAELVEVVRDKNQTGCLCLHLQAESTERFAELQKRTEKRIVKFGDTCQDIQDALGCPSRVFYKSEDKMKIHLPTPRRALKMRRTDFFFNYFTLGLDILFDAETHEAKKFVLHNNFPGHYDFGIYHRCNFRAMLDGLDVAGSSQAAAMQFEPHSSKSSSLVVTPQTKWNELQPLLDMVGSEGQQPVVLNRSSSNGANNPFGSTFCYGYQDMIFEVMTNNYIASVTCYRSKQRTHSVDEQ